MQRWPRVFARGHASSAPMTSLAVEAPFVVGTTKYSEQNHNPKEKGFKLKEYSRLKGHESFSEFTSKNRPSRPSWLCGLSARSPGESPPAHYNWL